MRNTRTYFLTAFLLLAACSDPQGPCDVGDACRFEGPHLVASVELQGEHPDVGGLPGVTPGPVTLTLDVSNQGDTITPPALVTVGISGPGLEDAVYEYALPAMLPGDVRRGPVVVNLDAPVLTGSDVRHAWIRIEEQEDAGSVVLASAESDDFRVLLPVLDFELSAVPDTVMLGSAATVTVRVQNASQFVALAATQLALRLRNTTYADTFPGWMLALPAIPAGQTYQDALTGTVPGNGGFWLDGYNHLYGTEAQQTFDTYQTYRLEACLEGTGLCVESGGTVRGQIDLEACMGGTAVIGATVPVTIRCTDTFAGPVAVWRFHGEAGDMFQFQVTNAGGPGVTRVLKRDGTLVASYNSMNPGTVLQQSGDHYLVFWSAQNPLTQPTLTTQQPMPPAGANP
jgi:hypothetical protein